MQSRGGKGLTNYHTDRYGKVVGIKTVRPEEDLIMISSDGIMIRMQIGEIRQCSRTSKGVTVMRMAGDGRIVSIAKATHEDGEELAHPEDDGTADEGAGDENAPVEAPAADEPTEE